MRQLRLSRSPVARLTPDAELASGRGVGGGGGGGGAEYEEASTEVHLVGRLASSSVPGAGGELLAFGLRRTGGTGLDFVHSAIKTDDLVSWGLSS